MQATRPEPPLEITTVAVPHGPGRIGMTSCPGKHDPSAEPGNRDRDLDRDLAAIQTWGAAAIVTLMTEAELVDLGVGGLGRGVAAYGLAWVHLPIPDEHTPTEAFEQAWPMQAGPLRAMLADGQGVIVHCRGGAGRTGMIAARLLVELGLTPKEALERVRSVKPEAIETREQERYVLHL